MARKDLLEAVLGWTPEPIQERAEGSPTDVTNDRGHDSMVMMPDLELTAELDRRIAALDRGEAKTVSLEEAEARVMRRLASVSKP